MSGEYQDPELDKKRAAMAKAREAKAAKRANPSEQMVPVSVVLDLQRRIAELETKPIPQTIPEAPPASVDNRPGSAVKVFTDKQGNDTFQKVRWNRNIMAEVYVPLVTFTPVETVDMFPHGVKYSLQADVETTVPSIVKSMYDEQIKNRKGLHQAYRYWTSDERGDLEARANDNPGTKQWSRVARLAAVGINVHSGEEDQGESKVG